MSAITPEWLYVGRGALLIETYYGLMQHSPSEIKEKLLKALDKEYNVVDMVAVLEIITILEKTPITKEALESTRLGRDINELRRKTKNESLAKRAKDLVRRWRHLILPKGGEEPCVTDSVHNGGSRNNSSLCRGGVKLPVVSPATSLPSSNQSSPSRVEAVPKTHAANKRFRKERSPPDTTDQASPDLPINKRLKLESVDSGSHRLNGDHYPDSIGSDCEIVSETPAPEPVPVPQPPPAPVEPPPKLKNRKKAPKDRTKKKNRLADEDIVKEKIASIARTPKVKTTQELLAGLQSKGESDGVDELRVEPKETGDSDVARHKTEHIARFLREGSSAEVITVDEAEPEEGLRKAEAVEAAPREARDSAEEILARLPPLDLDAIVWDSDGDDEGDASTLAAPPSPAAVERLLGEPVEGLNGNYDHRPGEPQFVGWHQTVSRASFNGELLHILPYCVID